MVAQLKAGLDSLALPNPLSDAFRCLNSTSKILTSRVYDVAVETPLQTARQLSERLGNSILLKREDLQPVFSFKIRGAYNKLTQLSDEERARGVVTASAGNHAQGLALAAKVLGVKATIVMPKTTPEIKVEGVRSRGGKVVLHGDSFPEALAYSLKLVDEKGYVYIHRMTIPTPSPGRAPWRWKSCASTRDAWMRSSSRWAVAG